MAKYSEFRKGYRRRPTREVMVGKVGVGGKNPIRVQSMTTTSTLDTLKTVEQTERLVAAGCEIVRITAQGPREAANLKNIKAELLRRGIDVPLVADIHFNPNAAMEAAKHVEKVRINPGNFADTKVFKKQVYTDSEYDSELQKIYDRFSPLVLDLKKRGVALRIGTNHGSLSDRIMNRYGDTPLGMVESALEFARICESYGYKDLMFSMKSSNPQVMVQAYRLLCERMYELGMDYPLHLGVTEAGDGEDGRVKSALGIGLLLAEGIGDTIRVSLTEEPEREIPVAFQLIDPFPVGKEIEPPYVEEEAFDILNIERQPSGAVADIGGKNVPAVFVTLHQENEVSLATLRELGYVQKEGKFQRRDISADYLVLDKEIHEQEADLLIAVREAGLKIVTKDNTGDFVLLDFQPKMVCKNSLIRLSLPSVQFRDVEHLINQNNIFVLSAEENYIGHVREFYEQKRRAQSLDPVVLLKTDREHKFSSVMLEASYELGGLLIDGMGDGVWLQTKYDKARETSFLFTLLQASRKRITRTDYISCPSCGRTLFDLQSTTARIRARTSHLKGVKIAIMGCIVNGLGEMADADFGYVGANPGKVNLYAGKQLIKRGVDEAVADEELINLIKEHGLWREQTEDLE